MKRYRAPKAKPGELKVQWGKIDRHTDVDVCYAWGEGLNRRFGAMAHYWFGSARIEMKDGKYVFGRSFIEALDEAGFDLTTLKFSIQKKKDSL